jgi:hypothetical protein
MSVQQRRNGSIVDGSIWEVHCIENHHYKMEYIFPELKDLLIEYHSAIVY